MTLKHTHSRRTSAWLLFWTTLTFGAFFVSEAAAQLRVSSIDWVQGRPEIPHPAMNGKNTILFAIAEGGIQQSNVSWLGRAVHRSFPDFY